jgi:phage gp29-like protein
MENMPLYDPYGRTIQTPAAKPDRDMLGTVRVRDQWSSYPSKGLDPAKLASILREADGGDILRQAELAEEMEEKDPDLASLLQTRKFAVQGLPWELIPTSDSPKDQEIADFCRQQLEDLDLDEPALDLLDAIFKGFACLEIQWELMGSQAHARKLEWIPQHRFTFLTQGATYDQPIPKLPNLLTEEQPIYGIETPPFKVIYHRHKSRSGLAQRGGLFRPISFFYLFKNYSYKDWLIFLEKYGQPTRIGKYTSAADKSAIEVLKDAVQNLGSDAAAVISDTTIIELLENKSTGASSNLYDLFVDRIHKSYAKAILGQTATSEGTPGALGAEKARSEVRDDLVKADAKMLAKTWKEQLIWPIVGYNFGWDVPLPTFAYHTEAEEDLNQLAQVHERLQKMGTPLPLSFIRKTYAIPEPVAGEEVLMASMQPEPVNPPQDPLIPAFLNGLQLKKKVVPIGARLVPINGERA